MSTDPLRADVTRAILTGDGRTSAADRKAAYDGGGPSEAAAYLDQVRFAAARVTDEHIAALRAAGHTDATIFELTVAATVGHVDRQHAAAEAALVAALAARGGS